MAFRKKKRPSKKVCVSKNFYHAMQTLKRMKGKRRVKALNNANDNFIKDLSSTLSKVRHQPPNILHTNPNLLRRIQFQRQALQRFSNKSTSMKAKRKMVKQKGGIIPALIPIIAAGIGALGAVGSGVGGAAVHAAISKS